MKECVNFYNTFFLMNECTKENDEGGEFYDILYELL
jgi:hypothetical protein